jgi:hypothetical protein
MKLQFTRTCTCPGVDALPTPAFKLTAKPDMSSDSPLLRLSIDLACPLCGKPWEGAAALLYMPKTPKSRIIT